MTSPPKTPLRRHASAVPRLTPTLPALLSAWLAVSLLLASCGSSGRGAQSRDLTRGAVSAVTAVPATTPTPQPWDAVPASGPGTRLGPWRLHDRFPVLAALADQGLAVLSRGHGRPSLVFRGSASIPETLRNAGWDHVGDPGAWHGYLFDAYQAPPSRGAKMFRVTTPAGKVHDFVHHLDLGELANNSFAAVAPGGQWLVSGEWGEMNRLLVFPTPLLNGEVPASSHVLPLAATISLDRPVRDVQGCSFVSATELLCSSDDPRTDLWPTPYQLLEVTLPAALSGAPTTARVLSLGELPLLSSCTGSFEVEGISFERSTATLRVEVRPPGRCGLAIEVYEYRRSAVAKPGPAGAAPAPVTALR